MSATQQSDWQLKAQHSGGSKGVTFLRVPGRVRRITTACRRRFLRQKESPQQPKSSEDMGEDEAGEPQCQHWASHSADLSFLAEHSPLFGIYTSFHAARCVFDRPGELHPPSTQFDAWQLSWQVRVTSPQNGDAQAAGKYLLPVLSL